MNDEEDILRTLSVQEWLHWLNEMGYQTPRLRPEPPELREARKIIAREEWIGRRRKTA